MDSLMDYLDTLEDMLESSKAVPFSNKVSVEKEKFFDIISEIRLNLPHEIRQAQRIIEDHDKIINEAKTKASNTLKEAENTVKKMTNAHEISKLAAEQAENLLEETKQETRDMRIGAMDYADSLLEKTERMIQDALTNLDQQHRIMDSYFSETIDVLYANRQELRGNK